MTASGIEIPTIWRVRQNVEENGTRMRRHTPSRRKLLCGNIATLTPTVIASIAAVGRRWPSIRQFAAANWCDNPVLCAVIRRVKRIITTAMTRNTYSMSSGFAHPITKKLTVEHKS
jgi:hypothetical protein